MQQSLLLSAIISAMGGGASVYFLISGMVLMALVTVLSIIFIDIVIQHKKEA